jgi:hypothetical protein
LNAPPNQRFLSISCLAALDMVPDLIDVLDDSDPAHVRDRIEAIVGLRRFIGRGTDYARQLYDPDKNTGLLIEKSYRPGEAKAVLDLLHDFSTAETREAATYEYLANYLRNEKLAVRQLAFFHLNNLLRGTRLPGFNYDPTGGPEVRQAGYTVLMDAIRNGKVPPPAPQPGGGGPGTRGEPR